METAALILRRDAKKKIWEYGQVVNPTGLVANLNKWATTTRAVNGLFKKVVYQETTRLNHKFEPVTEVGSGVVSVGESMVATRFMYENADPQSRGSVNYNCGFAKALPDTVSDLVRWLDENFDKLGEVAIWVPSEKTWKGFPYRQGDSDLAAAILLTIRTLV